MRIPAAAVARSTRRVSSASHPFPNRSSTSGEPLSTPNCSIAHPPSASIRAKPGSANTGSTRTNPCHRSGSRVPPLCASAPPREIPSPRMVSATCASIAGGNAESVRCSIAPPGNRSAASLSHPVIASVPHAACAGCR